MHTIKPMMKVTLAFEAGTGPNDMNIPLDHPDYEFIYGIGSGGLTPFEYTLADKTTGDDVEIHLHSAEVHPFFGHHHPPAIGLFLDREELFFNVRITAIAPAGSREVIKAMAAMTAHGGGGGCDCGGGCGCGCG